MKKQIFYCLLAVTLFTVSSCEKDYPSSSQNNTTVVKECEKNHTGRITITNGTSHQITLGLGNNMYDLASGSTYYLDLSVGTHAYAGVSDDNNYQWSGDIDITQCCDKGLNFTI